MNGPFGLFQDELIGSTNKQRDCLAGILYTCHLYYIPTHLYWLHSNTPVQTDTESETERNSEIAWPILAYQKIACQNTQFMAENPAFYAYREAILKVWAPIIYSVFENRLWDWKSSILVEYIGKIEIKI